MAAEVVSVTPQPSFRQPHTTIARKGARRDRRRVTWHGGEESASAEPRDRAHPSNREREGIRDERASSAMGRPASSAQVRDESNACPPLLGHPPASGWPFCLSFPSQTPSPANEVAQRAPRSCCGDRRERFVQPHRRPIYDSQLCRAQLGRHEAKASGPRSCQLHCRAMAMRTADYSVIAL